VPKTPGDQLRDLLAEQVRAATDEAIRSGGQVPAEQVDSLSRLARLVEFYQAAQPAPARRRWPVVMALASTLVIVSLLLFARVRETEIEADLSLSEVSFALPTQQQLTERIVLSTLGASGVRHIELPDRITQTTPSSDDAESRLSLEVSPDPKRKSTISLDPLALPAATFVQVKHGELPRQYRLSLTGKNTELRANVNGPVKVTLPGESSSAQIDFPQPDVFVMQSGEKEVDLDLTLLDPNKNHFSSQLSARDPSFFQIEDFRDPNSPPPRRVSTILSGTINFESLNGLERKIRPGEMIQLANSQVEIRTLRLTDDHIEMKFHGRVRGLNVGSDDSRRSLMPTWLEWLQARHSLSLLWGTAVYLFSLAIGALQWWRKPV
jgi:hypothetical protein